MQKTTRVLKSLLTAASFVALSTGIASAGTVNLTALPLMAASQASSSPTYIADSDAAADFLARASFGGSLEDINAIAGTDAADFLVSEFAKPATQILPGLLAREAAGETLNKRSHTAPFWDAMIDGDDQLRMRMTFALSQILVVADKPNKPTVQVAYYIDALSRNAFGNYRDLLEDVTYSPMMAEYLTYMRNRKANPRTGRMPDENYAREILQLFSIGLVELNADGTPKTNGSGEPIETYTNDDIQGLARVFTGLGLKGSSFRRKDAAPDALYSPLQAYENQHSDLEKTFLGLTIPAGTSADDSVEMALNHIFEHPNVGPFLSRQLIQRFTQSHPEPAYVARVSSAFERGVFHASNGASFGTGERGDMKATLAAILLDPSLYGADAADPVTSGKVREPILRFIHYLRAFDTANINSANEKYLNDTSDPGRKLGQHPLRSPSVFNFYRPGYVFPGTETGAMELTAPEFQLVNESTTIGYMNFMLKFIFELSPRKDKTVDTFAPDYSTEMALAEDVPALVEHLDGLLTGGRMSDAIKADIVETVEGYTVRPNKTNKPDRADNDRLKRVRLAILLTVNSPAFAVIR